MLEQDQRYRTGTASAGVTVGVGDTTGIPRSTLSMKPGLADVPNLLLKI